MGLFKKKAKDSSEIERLKSQIESMAAHLAAADQAKQQLGDQVQGIVTRLDAPPEPPPASVSPAEFSEVQSKLQAVVERVTAPAVPTVDPSHFEAVSAQVASLTERFDTPLEPPPDRGPQAPVVDPNEFEAVSATVNTLAGRMDGIDAVTAQVQTIAVRIDQLDARITSISNELANQITELSGDIDGLSSSDQPASELVDRLRDTQVKLANEQARYQIAFREDLAHLADFLRHT